MNSEELKILNSLIKEYELRARYNGGDDYDVYSVLIKLKKMIGDKQ